MLTISNQYTTSSMDYTRTCGPASGTHAGTEALENRLKVTTNIAG